MNTTTSAGTYMLSGEHVDALADLAADPDIATMLGGLPSREFVDSMVSAREAGTAWCFAIMEGDALLGLCTLGDVGNAEGAEIRVCIGHDQRRKGYATFAVRMIGDFAFRNLGLARLRGRPGRSAACRRVFEKNGFAAPSGPFVTVTRFEWQEFRHAPALAALHPDLKTLLVAELAAGNEVLETGGGWPDPDSVFVRLKNPFMARPPVLPDDVVYTVPGDPHWWKADYTTRSPRHILAC